jgi:hypothetical protein
MVAIHKQNGRYSPVVVCDYCGEVIDDALAAMEVSSRVPDGATAQAMHVHKGACDQALSAKLGGLDGSAELFDHLLELLRNTIGKSDMGRVRNAMKWSEE